MPLEKSASKPAFVRNLKAELSADKPRNQALAIAYSVMRKAKKRRADGGDISQDTTATDSPPPKMNLLDQAKSQYPVLKDLDYGYVENFKPNAGFLEHWNPGDEGAEPTSPTSLDALRPKEIPLDKHGLEIRDPSTRPIDVLGDIASHHLVNSDPVVKQTYQNLQDSITPAQNARLYDQYGYARMNEGENGSYDDWKQRAGMPGVLRGYTFQQWPKEFNDEFYTPEQMKSLDQLMDYFKTGKGPEKANGGTVRNPAVTRALAVARRAKGGKVHIGPIKSPHGGRTDTEEMKVPDGSYVLSADVVSHLGENNSDAGLKRAHQFFGPSGHFAKAQPRSSGGKSGGDGKPVECITAGGEYVIPPEVVRTIGGGDLDHGHKVLDRWSMNVRKDHIATLASLPPPAKD